jgi:hypothetical protein
MGYSFEAVINCDDNRESAPKVPKWLKRHMPCARSAFDCGSVQTVKFQLVADLFEHAPFGRADLAIGGSDVAGQRVSCLEQALWQGVADQAK